MPEGIFQFGTFELNKRSGELRKNGARIKLQEQPFQILVLLLDRPGEVVDREQIRTQLWPDNTFVDFDNAISSAVRKLREALSDNADTPRFIETVARRGYRFIGPMAVAPPRIEKARHIKAAAIATGVLLILGLAFWWLSPHARQDDTQLTPLPLTAAHGWERDPTFSPDGSEIAYAWDETGTGPTHIYMKQIDAGRPLQLTTGLKSDSYPVWSPDGRSIAFRRENGQSSAMYLIPPIGGSERKLADGYFVGGGSWSPDGRFLVVPDRKSLTEFASLYRIAVENGEEERLLTPANAKTEDRDPYFSPDGQMLLFTRCREPYSCRLDLLNLSGQYQPAAQPRQLTPETARILGAAWTSDGKEIVYARSSDVSLNFQLMRFHPGRVASVERLAYAGEHVFKPVIARHGNRLAYTQNFMDRDIWQVQLGKPPRSFVSSTRQEWAPQYSPDGKRVAFSSNRSGQTEIWACDAKGGSLVQLTHFEETSGSPQWSPDGRWIAFDRHMRTGWRIFVMASDGGQVRQVTSNDGDQLVPNWSRDGDSIYYTTNRTGRFEIWKTAAKGGQGVQVTRNGGWFAAESRDGNSLYYTKNLNIGWGMSALWTRPLRGGEEKLVLQSIGARPFDVREDGIYYFAWSARDGASSVGPSSVGASSVRFYDFATGKDREIAPVKDFGTSLAVSLDRKTFLFEMETRAGSNVMVVDNFH
ncbi:MAG TPA: winged helix-turn-helix domain-containing protein [Bryobacteraceae bacterium]|jgi:Tol biopolymer transport system component/DNA-binding winged helix-turn-helix (wHTH) protein